MNQGLRRWRFFLSIVVLFTLFVFNNNVVSAYIPTSLLSVDDSYTVSLLHMNGVDGSTILADESGKIWTSIGDIQTDTAQSKFGGSAAFFDGGGDCIELSDDEDFNVGSGDFTVDFWFKKNANGTYQPAFGQSDGAQSHPSLSVYGYMSLYNNKLEFGGYATSQINSKLIYIDSETAVTDTNWHHFAGVRSGSTLYLFLDGINEGTVDVGGYTFINSPYKMAIGRNGEYGGDYANGWIDEFRFSKGIARWTDNFIPPTAEYPFTAATPTPMPPLGVDDGYTVSLLRMNGPDKSVAFPDGTGKVWRPRGNVQIDTAQSIFGGASALFDGSGDYIDMPDHEDFNVGSGDFTVDFWFRKNVNGTNQPAFSQNDAAVSATSLSIYGYTSVDNRIHFGGNMGSSRVISLSGSTSVTDTNWHHYAVARSGNTLYLFLDGFIDGTRDVTGVTFNNSSNKFAIGRVGEWPVEYANGWIDEFRFSKGIARWTSNFTPPTSEYAIAISTPTPTLTLTQTLTYIPTSTFTPTSMPTLTLTVTASPTFTFTPTATFMPTVTFTPTSTSTYIPTPTPTPKSNGYGTCWLSKGSWATYTVYYDIATTSIPSNITASEWTALVEISTQTWNNVTPSHFTFVRQTGNNNTVRFEVPNDPNWLAGTPNPAGSITSTYTKVNPNMPWDVNNTPLPNDPSHNGSTDTYNLQNTVTHELGHWLYLDDINDTNCTDVTMDHDVGFGELIKIDLHTADENAINWQYP